jgi:hypothetical protein
MSPTANQTMTNQTTTNQATTNQRATNPTTCDETRATRLHYQLRCLLTAGHEGDHAWTPELLPADEIRASA